MRNLLLKQVASFGCTFRPAPEDACCMTTHAWKAGPPAHALMPRSDTGLFKTRELLTPREVVKPAGFLMPRPDDTSGDAWWLIHAR